MIIEEEDSGSLEGHDSDPTRTTEDHDDVHHQPDKQEEILQELRKIRKYITGGNTAPRTDTDPGDEMDPGDESHSTNDVADWEDEQIQLESELSGSSVYESVSQSIYLVYDGLVNLTKLIEHAQFVLQEIPSGAGQGEFYDDAFERLDEISSSIYGERFRLGDWINDNCPTYLSRNIEDDY